ncbi:GNAT family N-acetyltransferase [Flavobacterium sp. ANB]|uniref:GNAT family N-acetyltransferase n=1 Tax=unclassified Flavobacterium TaxID=196869 RepID=UPI0012B928C3|nr:MULTISPECIES: GNAT family N-acetyltransferase [unclassified Flavobacterium]MBF4515944.1 GNAT family N-acetyltransferase [Flavobacterium sp. ANB]MTD68946.1 GNAT family N-acetyltransferase [Flavobacterium sp. LC2016-13]
MIPQKAKPNDHEILTIITKKSKAYWGYSAEQIEVWSDSLTVTKNDIETKSVYKLNIDNQIVAYYSFFDEDEETVKLDNLFVLPEYIGKGIGVFLMNDFLHRLKETNFKKIRLHSEPNAEMFYAKFGFIKVGQLESSIKNRYLPILELEINSNKEIREF